MGLTAPAVAAAATVTVSTTSDSPATGQCSLREAVLYADGTAEPGCAPGTATPPTTIKVPAGTYTLTGGGLSITASTTITGAGASKTTVSGGNAFQPFNVAAGVIAAFNGLTITQGLSGVPSTGCTGPPVNRSCPAENGNSGGGIANAGTLTLSGVVVSGNAASGGTLPFSSVVVLCTIQGCPIRPGKSGGSGGGGGGILNLGTLTVQDSTISGNTAGGGASGTNAVSGTGIHASAGQPGGSGGSGGYGGGIENIGTLTVIDSTIAGNRAGAAGDGGAGSNATASSGNGGNAGSPGFSGGGGGIASNGPYTLTGSTVADNTSGRGGQGAPGGSPTGTGSPGARSGSSGGGNGGGIWAAVGTGQNGQLTDDTVTGNTTQPGGTAIPVGLGGFGAGIYIRGGLLQLSFVTVSGNSSSGIVGGLLADTGSITEADSIVASNTGTPPMNCFGNVVDDGHNLVFGESNCPGTNADPRLGPLADNGGPTQTEALRAGSGAINLVPVAACPVPTDQRGVVRPQGGRCDAGAYEFAPPTITAPAASAGSTSAQVSGAVNANLRDTKVLVRYGRTAQYGSSTRTHDIGSGNNDNRISIPLNGLARGRTYHAQIVATNGDGTTTTRDLTFTTGQTVAILSAATRTSTKGGVLKLKIGCRGPASGRCSGPITITSHVTRRAGKPVAVAAAARPRKIRTLVIVAAGRYSVPGGATRTITLRLNRTGQSLLKRFHRLPATLTVSGAKPPTRRIVFHTAKPKPKHRKHRHG